MKFLFSRLDYSIIILDFENIPFFDSGAIFRPFVAPGKSFLTWRTLLKIPLLFVKKKNWKIFWKSFRKCSKLLRNIYFGPPRTIWSLRKWKSKIKSSKNRETHANPPLVSYLRDMQCIVKKKSWFWLILAFWGSLAGWPYSSIWVEAYGMKIYFTERESSKLFKTLFKSSHRQFSVK